MPIEKQEKETVSQETTATGSKPEKTNIHKKLLAVQSELKAPKGQYNSFGKYKYRSCEDVLEAIKPLLAENGLVLTLRDEIEEHTPRFYIKATATLIDVETGDELSNVAYAREEDDKKGMDGSQVTGASSSYARKYALNGLFAIDDNKDSDTTNDGGAKLQAPKEKPKEKTKDEIEFDNAIKETRELGSRLTNLGYEKADIQAIASKFNDGKPTLADIKTIDVCKLVLAEFKQMLENKKDVK